MIKKRGGLKGWSWFKLYDLGLVLGMNSCISVEKRTITKSQKVLTVNSYSWRSYSRKTGIVGLKLRVKVHDVMSRILQWKNVLTSLNN